jgi:hypothetical protein
MGSDTEWINPYQATEIGADTLAMVSEGRLEMKWQVGQERDWRIVGGAPDSWRQAIKYIDLYYRAGMITTSTGMFAPSGMWVPTRLTQAGQFLYQAWISHPFTAIPREGMAVEEAMAKIAETYGWALKDL